MTEHADTNESWSDFSTRLAKALGTLQDRQFLILFVHGTGPEQEGTEQDGTTQDANYFVQFAQQEDNGFRAEAVANTYLVGSERLGLEQEARLEQLGWQPPTHTPDDDADAPVGSPNWFRDWDDPLPPPYPEIADFAITTLREIYGAENPRFLTYHALGPRGERIELPGLGLDEEPPEPAESGSTEVPLDAD